MRLTKSITARREARRHYYRNSRPSLTRTARALQEIGGPSISPPLPRFPRAETPRTHWAFRRRPDSCAKQSAEAAELLEDRARSFSSTAAAVLLEEPPTEPTLPRRVCSVFRSLPTVMT